MGPVFSQANSTWRLPLRRVPAGPIALSARSGPVLTSERHRRTAAAGSRATIPRVDEKVSPPSMVSAYSPGHLGGQPHTVAPFEHVSQSQILPPLAAVPSLYTPMTYLLPTTT